MGIQENSIQEYGTQEEGINEWHSNFMIIDLYSEYLLILK